jgi:hypothetical protein
MVQVSARVRAHVDFVGRLRGVAVRRAEAETVRIARVLDVLRSIRGEEKEEKTRMMARKSRTRRRTPRTRNDSHLAGW